MLNYNVLGVSAWIKKGFQSVPWELLSTQGRKEGRNWFFFFFNLRKNEQVWRQKRGTWGKVEVNRKSTIHIERGNGKEWSEFTSGKVGGLGLNRRRDVCSWEKEEKKKKKRGGQLIIIKTHPPPTCRYLETQTGVSGEGLGLNWTATRAISLVIMDFMDQPREKCIKVSVLWKIIQIHEKWYLGSMCLLFCEYRWLSGLHCSSDMA